MSKLFRAEEIAARYVRVVSCQGEGETLHGVHFEYCVDSASDVRPGGDERRKPGRMRLARVCEDCGKKAVLLETDEDGRRRKCPECYNKWMDELMRIDQEKRMALARGK